MGTLGGKGLKESIGEQKWEALKTKSEKWDGLDKYGNLWRSTDWNSGPSNKHLHNSCYTSLSSARLSIERKKCRTQLSKADHLHMKVSSCWFPKLM